MISNVLLLIRNCHGEYCWDLTISFSDTLTIMGAIAAFIIALYQYKKSQRWKRAEFVYQLITSFKDDFNVKRAFRILDWNRIDIPLLENEIEGKNNFWFDDELFVSSLRVHFEMNKDEDGFSDEEAIVRLITDDFLDKLGMFYHYINKGLISKDDVQTYLIYWIRIIADKNNPSKSNVVREHLWKYILQYKFNDVVSLCELFSYKIA
ncbi:MAG: hypothetical protein EHM93_06560 [Bacteroidales bacterium]|nr:MAG: hypothetical protein EHM93_06560 [Bacteroidales bacterium]